MTGSSWDTYRDERVKLGHEDPGPFVNKWGGNFFYLSRNPEEDWERIVPYAVHEDNTYNEDLTAVGLDTFDWHASKADTARPL